MFTCHLSNGDNICGWNYTVICSKQPKIYNCNKTLVLVAIHSLTVITPTVTTWQFSKTMKIGLELNCCTTKQRIKLCHNSGKYKQSVSFGMTQRHLYHMQLLIDGLLSYKLQIHCANVHRSYMIQDTGLWVLICHNLHSVIWPFSDSIFDANGLCWNRFQNAVALQESLATIKLEDLAICTMFPIFTHKLELIVHFLFPLAFHHSDHILLQ